MTDRYANMINDGGPERIWIESDGGCPYFYPEEELSDVAPPITEYVRADKLEELAAEIEGLRAEVEKLRADHPAAIHCDTCGCDWLDNGLNPIGCPYCKHPAAVDEAMVERACRHWYNRWDEADQATKMLWAEMMYDLLAAALAPPPADPGATSEQAIV